MKQERFVIIDWAGNRCLTTKTFATFEDGWQFIYDKFGHLDDRALEDELQEYEVIPNSELSK